MKIGLDNTLRRLVKRISDDPRMGPPHVTLLFALLMRQGAKCVVEFDSSQRLFICRDAKISATTFHRCIHDLHSFGYLQYFPSYNPKEKNKIIIYD